MTYTFDESIVSDLHKDAYGFRPTNRWWAIWEEAEDKQKQRLWDGLLEDLEWTVAVEKQQTADAVAAFEERIDSAIAAGAGNRFEATRWILQAEELDKEEDAGYICYRLHLPYSYEETFKIHLTVGAQ